jgi:hypothetical protein
MACRGRRTGAQMKSIPVSGSTKAGAVIGKGRPIVGRISNQAEDGRWCDCEQAAGTGQSGRPRAAGSADISMASVYRSRNCTGSLFSEHNKARVDGGRRQRRCGRLPNRDGLVPKRGEDGRIVLLRARVRIEQQWAPSFVEKETRGSKRTRRARRRRGSSGCFHTACDFLFIHTLRPRAYLPSSTTVLMSVPIPPPTLVSTTSPWRRTTGGVRVKPTPAGVPVMSMLPGISVVPWLRNASACATLNSWFLARTLSVCGGKAGGGGTVLGVPGLHRLPVEHGPERERLRVGQRVRGDNARPDRRRVVCPPRPQHQAHPAPTHGTHRSPWRTSPG